MASSALIRALRRLQSSVRYVASIHFQSIMENRWPNIRQFSVFKEFSKNLKGEAKSNAEFQRQVKELNEKIGGVTKDLKMRTKKTAEKLYKSVDDIWAEAEAKTKKVSVNAKERLTDAKDEVSTNVKEKFSVAKEEVKETFGLGKKASSESTYASTNSFNAKEGGSTTSGTETSQSTEASTKESVGQSDTLFGKFKSTFSSAPPVVSSAFQKLKDTKVSDLAKKGYCILKDELTSNPSKTRWVHYASTNRPSEYRSTRTDIVVVPSRKSCLGEKWEAFKKKMEGIPLYKRMEGVSEPVVTNVVNKGQEDMRERWEISDHPVVHKIQDLNETVFGENATALRKFDDVTRKIYFSLPYFVAEVQEMIRPVLTAYLKGDVETLKKYCSSEVIEQCKGQHTAFESQGMFFDSKILHIFELDVREAKMMGSTPIIIVGFQTQQIYCVRDRKGSITGGGKDTIHTVYYAWAMQQMDVQELGKDALFPLWKLREMQQIGMQALI